MAFIAAPPSPYTFKAGVTVPISTTVNIIKPAALTAGNPTFQPAFPNESAGGTNKPYAYAIT